MITNVAILFAQMFDEEQRVEIDKIMTAGDGVIVSFEGRAMSLLPQRPLTDFDPFNLLYFRDHVDVIGKKNAFENFIEMDGVVAALRGDRLTVVFARQRQIYDANCRFGIPAI